MPSKYDYQNTVNNGSTSPNTGSNAITFSINPGATSSREVTSDYTFVADDLDVTFRANAGNAITLTADVSVLPEGWTARVINQSGNNVTISVDDSNFDGTATVIGSANLNGAGDSAELRHLEPGVVSIDH